MRVFSVCVFSLSVFSVCVFSVCVLCVFSLCFLCVLSVCFLSVLSLCFLCVCVFSVCVWNFSREVKLVPAFHLFKTSFQVLDLRYLTLAFGAIFVIHFIGFSWHLVLDNLYYWILLTFGI